MGGMCTFLPKDFRDLILMTVPSAVPLPEMGGAGGGESHTAHIKKHSHLFRIFLSFVTRSYVSQERNLCLLSTAPYFPW